MSCCGPQQLFGLTGLDEISHCLLWSLLANIGAYLAFSLRRVPDGLEGAKLICSSMLGGRR